MEEFVADTLTLHLSEDAFEGDAQFTVDVDGTQIAGPTSVTTLHSSGTFQDFTYTGDFGAGPHTVAVNFLNDAYGGTADTDRNLYVGGLTFDGTNFAGETAQNDAMNGQPDADPNAAEMYVNGTTTFSNVAGAPPPPAALDSIVVYGAGGFGQFTVTVDGTTIGNAQLGESEKGQIDTFTFTGAFGPGPHTVDLHYTPASPGPGIPNPFFVAYGIDLNGQHYNIGDADITSSGAVVTDPSATTMTDTGDIIFHNVAEGTSTPDVTINGGMLADHLRGGPGNDIIQAGPGIANGPGPHDNTEFGEAGHDTFIVIAGNGNDSVNFQSGAGGDVVDLVNYGYTSFADVMSHMTATSTGSVLTNPNGETIGFFGSPNPTPDTFTPDNFVLDGATSSVADQLVVHVSEDAFQGNAEYAVLVDGKQVGVIQQAFASHSQGQVDNLSLVGHFGADPHTVEVQFVNDAYGGSPDADRNLYVEGITFNGVDYPGQAAANTAQNGQPDADPNAAEMYINGSVTFNNVGGSGPPPPPSGSTSTIAIQVSEDAFQGDAQFNVRVDGAAQIATFTAHASHAAGQSETINITGDFGAQGPGTIDIQFLNDAYGGTPDTDRNLYVQSIDVNGVHFQGNTAINDAANGHEADDPTAAVMDINGTAEFNVNHTAPPPEIMG
jgi:hypothetical protein